MSSFVYWFLFSAPLLPAAAQLGDHTLDRWLDFVRPSRQELAWQEIPWRPALWPAVIEARQADKPLLIWAMNGHPMACT
jgi:hypothetical protein